VSSARSSQGRGVGPESGRTLGVIRNPSLDVPVPGLSSGWVRQASWRSIARRPPWRGAPWTVAGRDSPNASWHRRVRRTRRPRAISVLRDDRHPTQPAYPAKSAARRRRRQELDRRVQIHQAGALEYPTPPEPVRSSSSGPRVAQAGYRQALSVSTGQRRNSSPGPETLRPRTPARRPHGPRWGGSARRQRAVVAAVEQQHDRAHEVRVRSAVGAATSGFRDRSMPASCHRSGGRQLD